LILDQSWHQRYHMPTATRTHRATDRLRLGHLHHAWAC